MKGISHHSKLMPVSRSVESRIIDARKAGMSYEKIADLEQINHVTIYAVCKKNGVLRGYKKTTTHLQSALERKQEFHIDDILILECDGCGVKNENISLVGSPTLKKDFCPKCLYDMTIESLKKLAGSSFNQVLNELFA